MKELDFDELEKVSGGAYYDNMVDVVSRFNKNAEVNFHTNDGKMSRASVKHCGIIYSRKHVLVTKYQDVYFLEMKDIQNYDGWYSIGGSQSDFYEDVEKINNGSIIKKLF